MTAGGPPLQSGVAAVVPASPDPRGQPPPARTGCWSEAVGMPAIAVLTVEPLVRPPQTRETHVDLPTDLPLSP